MKPGVSCACTGVWPIWRAYAASSAHTLALVLSPAMTSTTFISGTGLKKWNPANCAGRLSLAAIAVTDNDEVLVASTVDGLVSASSSAKSWVLTSSRSTTASTISVQLARSASAGAQRKRDL